MKTKIPAALRERWNALPLKKRQYAFLGSCVTGGFLLVWAMLSIGSDDKPARSESVVKIGKNASATKFAAPGKISALDEWVGNAGRKLAQYEKDKAQQEKINAEREQNEKRIFERLEQMSKHGGSPAPAPDAAAGTATPPAPVEASAPVPTPPPPPAPPSRMSSPAAGPLAMPPGTPPAVGPADAASPAPIEPPAPPVIGHVTLGSVKGAPPDVVAKGIVKPTGNDRARENVTKGDAGTFLPVGFARGELLGGIDAPTGAQAQSNPQPVLIRLSDNAILPNRFRAQVRECLVVAAGYGDISSERALFRTISLSCVRHDGTVLETELKGSVFGEDGKLGLRGRLVTKQGQILANALRAGIVGGIGDGFSRAGTTISTGAFGSVASQSGDTQENMQRGLMKGVGKAMDQLADYYVHLAEKTFPIIEIDASRKVDVVITKGVYLPMSPGAPTSDDDAFAGDQP